MKETLLKVWEVIGGCLGVAFVLWIWFSPNQSSRFSSRWNSREDFEAFVQQDEDEKALERALETLHHNRQ